MLTKKRIDQLVKECSQDLERAKLIKHRPWIETLTNRLASLKKIRVVEEPATKVEVPESDSSFIRHGG